MHVFAVSDSNIRSEVLNMLPTDLSNIDKSTDLKSISKKFSKQISRSEKDAVYLNYFSKSNDVTIGLKNKKVSYVLLKVPFQIRSKAQNLFEKAYLRLSKEDQRKLLKNNNSHEAGMLVEIKLPEEALLLKFKNTDKKELHSVIFWTPGEKLP